MKGVIRPEAVVLDDSALIPNGHLIAPPPDQFTHELTRSQRFDFTGTEREPAGELLAGSKVVLVAWDGGSHCYVIEERGLYVRISHQALRALER